MGQEGDWGKRRISAREKFRHLSRKTAKRIHHLAFVPIIDQPKGAQSYHMKEQKPFLKKNLGIWASPPEIFLQNIQSEALAFVFFRKLYRWLICMAGMITHGLARWCASHKIQSVPKVTPMELEPTCAQTQGDPSAHFPHILMAHACGDGRRPLSFLISNYLDKTKTKDRASFIVIPNRSKPGIILDFTCLKPGNRKC